jgi:hypothetical protein
LEGPPLSEFNKARGPVGGALPDIIEPKEADVVEDEESEYRERVVDRASQPCSLLTLVLGLFKSTPATSPPLFPLSLFDQDQAMQKMRHPGDLIL